MTRGETKIVDQVRAMIASGSHAEAALLCEEHLRAAPIEATAHILEGLMLSIQGRQNDAIAAYDTALAFDPGALAAYLGIAEILAEKGWLSSAVVVMENARDATDFTSEAQGALDELRTRLAQISQASGREKL